MLTGEALGAFALTEPHAGSDAAAIRTRAERVGPADAPTAYRLTGTKIWISNAPEADRYLVFATLGSGGRREGDHGVPRSRRGRPVSGSGRTSGRWGSGRARPRSSCFDGAEVPAGNRLGAEGEGYKIALSALGEGRISIAPHASDRAGRAGGVGPLSWATEGVRGAAGGQQGCASCSPRWRGRRRRAGAHQGGCCGKDRGEPLAEVSSLAKWTASDVAMRVATDAVQLFGASGYSRRDRHRAVDARR
jgi:alkylation response protein AidB-like acyl-CoA dehydrogenase